MRLRKVEEGFSLSGRAIFSSHMAIMQVKPCTMIGMMAFLTIFWIEAVCYASPTTSDFMNVITACGMGVRISIDNDTKDKAKNLFEQGVSTGRAVQEIVPGAAELVLGGQQSQFYDKYVKCLRDLLSPSTQPGLPADILNTVKLGSFGETSFDYVQSLLGTPRTQKEDSFLGQKKITADFENSSYQVRTQFSLDGSHTQLTGIKIHTIGSPDPPLINISFKSYWNRSSCYYRSFSSKKVCDPEITSEVRLGATKFKEFFSTKTCPHPSYSILRPFDDVEFRCDWGKDLTKRVYLSASGSQFPNYVRNLFDLRFEVDFGRSVRNSEIANKIDLFASKDKEAQLAKIDELLAQEFSEFVVVGFSISNNPFFEL